MKRVLNGALNPLQLALLLGVCAVSLSEACRKCPACGDNKPAEGGDGNAESSVVARGRATTVDPSVADVEDDEFVFELEEEQVAQVRRERNFLDRMERNPSLLRSRGNQRRVVNVTTVQKRGILKRYRRLFSKRSQLPSIARIQRLNGALQNLSVDSASEEASRRGRERRSAAAGPRACEAVMSWDALNLAVDAEGEVVQIAQFEDETEKQWQLMETCEAETSALFNMGCVEDVRLVQAYIINTSTYKGQVDWVEIYCCVGRAYA